MTEERADRATPSPYNASLLVQMQAAFRAFRAGELNLLDLQSFVSSRQSLFENDRTGVALATLHLEGEFESIIYGQAGDRAATILAIDEYLDRFDPGEAEG